MEREHARFLERSAASYSPTKSVTIIKGTKQVFEKHPEVKKQ
jgi:hypothetical protein